MTFEEVTSDADNHTLQKESRQPDDAEDVVAMEALSRYRTCSRFVVSGTRTEKTLRSQWTFLELISLNSVIMTSALKIIV